MKNIKLKDYILNEAEIINVECTMCGRTMEPSEQPDDDVCPYCNESAEFIYEWNNEGLECCNCGKTFEPGEDAYTKFGSDDMLCVSCFEKLSIEEDD